MIIPEIKLTLTYKNGVKTNQLTKVRSSKDIYAILDLIYPKDELLLREKFFVIFLNHANGILGYNELSSGGLTGTVVDIKHLFMLIFKMPSSSIILTHNHPSGTLRPSQADLRLTNKIKEACQLVDVQVLDHVIFTDYGYYSFADEGAL